MKSIPSPQEISEKLVPFFDRGEVRLVLLFGSVASGRVHQRSDIDLAVLLEGDADILAVTNGIIRRLGTDRVDVVDLKRASPLLKVSVARTGRVLYEKTPGLFSEFRSLAHRMYADTKKLRDARAMSLKNFLRERGVA